MIKRYKEASKVLIRFKTELRAIILLLLFTINFLQAQTPEYQVKLLLMREIANRYINWPKETGMDNRNKPFVIGIVGESSFGKYLEHVYNPKQQPLKIRNKIVVLKNISRIEQIPGCHFLFVSDLPRRFLSIMVESIQDKPILTLTDTVDYVEEGIHISFMLGKTSEMPVTSEEHPDKRKSTVGLVINEKAARQSDLEISEELRNIARVIVHPYRPYEEKAKYLEPISRFIDWPPASAMADPLKPFKIEVLGQNSFGPYLDKIFKKKKLKNKPVVIRHISRVKEISHPHILFISKSMKNKITEIIAYTKNKPILTIGDTPGFHQAGVLINFLYDRLKLCFEVNKEAAIAAGFNISYHLLLRAKSTGTQLNLNQEP
jgi:hypothetical protein